jgi:MFS family permease
MVHGLTLIAFFAASSLPTPLYHLYQATWRFSASTLTAIFSVYALALLVALLLGARLSDHLGRRPVILAAIALEIVAMAAFALASDSNGLILARALQGLATGLATAAVGAALIDADPAHGSTVNSISPMFGLAAGALGSTALAQLLPAPLVTGYVVIAVLLAGCAWLTWITDDVAPRRPGALASLRPRVSVPAHARDALLAVTPLNIALWMLGGFYLSLMPTLVANALHVTSLWLGGCLVALLTFSGALAVWAGAKRKALSVLIVGAVLLAAGTAGIRWSASNSSAVGLMIGSVLAGLGFGGAFLGAIRTVLPLAEPHERSHLMGVFYIESYLSFSAPTIALGFLVQRIGLLRAVNYYTAIIVALVAVAIVWVLVKRRHVEPSVPGRPARLVIVDNATAD